MLLATSARIWRFKILPAYAPNDRLLNTSMHVQSLVKSAITILLKIVAASFQWLNVDPLGQGEKLFFRQSQGTNMAFCEKSQGKVVLFRFLSKCLYKRWKNRTLYREKCFVAFFYNFFRIGNNNILEYVTSKLIDASKIN